MRSGQRMYAVKNESKKENIMDTRDNTLVTTLRGIIKQEIELALYVRDKEPKNESPIDIEDYRGDIETMISEYINYNVTVTIEG